MALWSSNDDDGRYDMEKGIALALLGALSGAAGDVTVKLSFNHERKRAMKRPLWRRPLWLFGTFIDCVITPIASLTALCYVAGSTANLCSGMHICFSVFLAWLILGERLALFDIAACGLIVAGLYLIARYGPGRRNYYYNEIFVDSFGLYSYVGICFSLSICCIIASLPIQAIYEEIPIPVQEIATATVAGIAGANTNLCAKGAIVIASSEGWMSSYLFQFVLLLSLSAITGLVLLVYLNYGLWRFRASLVVPSVYSVLVITGTSGGIALYNEVPMVWGMFMIGVVLEVVSIFLLSISFHERNTNTHSDPLAKQTYNFPGGVGGLDGADIPSGTSAVVPAFSGMEKGQ